VQPEAECFYLDNVLTMLAWLIFFPSVQANVDPDSPFFLSPELKLVAGQLPLHVLLEMSEQEFDRLTHSIAAAVAEGETFDTISQRLLDRRWFPKQDDFKVEEKYFDKLIERRYWHRCAAEAQDDEDDASVSIGSQQPQQQGSSRQHQQSASSSSASANTEAAAALQLAPSSSQDSSQGRLAEKKIRSMSVDSAECNNVEPLIKYVESAPPELCHSIVPNPKKPKNIKAGAKRLAEDLKQRHLEDPAKFPVCCARAMLEEDHLAKRFKTILANKEKNRDRYSRMVSALGARARLYDHAG